MVVLTGSAPLDTVPLEAVAGADLIIAADGGLDHARAVGLQPDVLVGDLDSISAEGLAWATANIAVERHPADKSATDTELALQYAALRRPHRIVLLAGQGDRIDHAIAALGALAHEDLDDVQSVEAWWGSDYVTVARPRRPAILTQPAGTTFSVLALHGPCRGVTVTGSRWPLQKADLAPLIGLGVSNEVLDSPCHVDVTEGVVTVIVPGAQP